MRTFFFDHQDQMKVRVYRNLNKAGPNVGCWSVKSHQRENFGRVILHCSDVILQGAKPRVSEKGRQRVLRDKCKNVHAYIEGYLVAATVLEERYFVDATTKVPSNGPLCPGVEEGEIEISYNPYLGPNFFEKESNLIVPNTRAEIHLNEDHTVSLVPHQFALAA